MLTSFDELWKVPIAVQKRMPGESKANIIEMKVNKLNDSEIDLN